MTVHSRTRSLYLRGHTMDGQSCRFNSGISLVSQLFGEPAAR